MKETDSQPNARGDCMIGGVVYEVSAWTKKDKNGNPWQSLAFKPKDTEQRQQAPKQDTKQGAKRGFDELDSDIPFANPYRNRYYYY